MIRSDCVEEILGPVYLRDVICTKKRLRTPVTNQLSKKDRYIVRNARVQLSASSVAFHADIEPSLGGPCVLSNLTKAPGSKTFGIATPITCVAFDAHPSTPPFECCRTRETELQRNGTRSSLVANPNSISAVMTTLFVCGDPVVNASILPLPYIHTTLP
ncbi:uncharacterized protein TNCV_2860601 [Trichonephila clavipes]|nr:uncharacterized protein TNCV_2860601 [Trichonephila clavipes]